MRDRSSRHISLIGELGIAVVLAGEVALFAFLSPYFLTSDNLLNIALQTSVNAIIAAGMTYVILTAGIDLSVGSLVAFTGIVATSSLSFGGNTAAMYMIALASGIGTGAVSGFLAGKLITTFRITPFIVTLALMTVWRGLAFVVTDGRPVWELPPEFSLLASERMLGIPLPAIIMAMVMAVSAVSLTRTRFGRHVYAVGGNPEAARLAGINTNRVLTIVYTISGGLAGLSGVLLAARVNSGQPNAGLMYELDAIAAVVVGGTSLFGGRGSIAGTLLGALLIGVLRNGLNLLNVDSYLQQVIVGVVILAAVMSDRSRERG
jgi:ribose/xylose/arabinose/galactoside ABC-type transport system permease subunit